MLFAHNVLRPCAGRISQTFAANRTEVHREVKDFGANAPLRQNGEADHYENSVCLLRVLSGWRKTAVTRRLFILRTSRVL